MSLKDYKYFVAVAEEQHFGRAAARCNVSQPTLSVQLKKLEEQLGVLLFERHPRQVVLTMAGQVVLAKARQMLRLEQEILQLAQAATDPLGGPLRLGIIPTIGPYLLPHFVPYQTQAAPQLKPLLTEAKTEDLLQMLREGTLDAAVLALPLDDVDDLATTPLYQEFFYLALPETHPLTSKKLPTTQDIPEGELLLLTEGHCLRGHALDVCEFLGAAENASLRATSLETLRYMVMAGQGVTLLPSLALDWPDKSIEGGSNLPSWPHMAIRPVKGTNMDRPARQIGVVFRYGYPRASALKKMFLGFAAHLIATQQGLAELDAK